MSRKKDAGKPVQLRDDDRRWTINLTGDDFRVLKHMAGGAMQVKHCEKEFARMRELGLVKHRFATLENTDWPVAIVELTPAGNQALAQELV